MELCILRCFLTAAREETIPRAAEKLHVTQPTPSRQLMQPEENLGLITKPAEVQKYGYAPMPQDISVDGNARKAWPGYEPGIGHFSKWRLQ